MSLRSLLSLTALLALGAVATLAAALAAAWFATPAATGLAARVEARLRAAGAPAVAAGPVSRTLRDAVVATEDERFYRHHGVDILGVLRALPYDVTHLSLAQGGSTITEQVAKLLYLHGNDHDPWRKLQDAALALKLEGHYSKTQILAAYLDSVYFGDGAYGATAAARRYFGLPPARLDTAQASLLAGLIQAPSTYDPRRHPALARARQVEVLRSLVRNGFLTERAAAAVLARPLRLSGGARLAPVLGVDLAPGPTFTWWQLSLGLGVAVVAAAALAALRLGTHRRSYLLVALRATTLVLLVLGVAVAIRAFRTA
jgi:penicillin-binding protein 1A